MTVTVDDRPVETTRLGLRTVGQVLAHAASGNRLVVHVLIDGLEPDYREMERLRSRTLDGGTLFIETAEPREMALEVLSAVGEQIDAAERLQTEAASLLQAGDASGALSNLSGLFTIWQHARESVEKTAQLLRLDLDAVRVRDQSLSALLDGFGAMLRQVRSALEARDYVLLADVLVYDMTNSMEDWRATLDAVRLAILARA